MNSSVVLALESYYAPTYIMVRDYVEDCVAEVKSYLETVDDPRTPYLVCSAVALGCIAIVPFAIRLGRKCCGAGRDLEENVHSLIHFYAGRALGSAESDDNRKCIDLLSQYPYLVNTVLDADRSHGYTPFLRACWNNNLQLIKFMLDIGADIKLTNADREGALYLVAYRVSKSPVWDPRAMNLLWQLGCSVDDVNVHNNSMLHLAAKAGHATLTRWLLVHGADPQVTNDAGYTPYSLALKRGQAGSPKHLEVAGLLPSRGVEDNGVQRMVAVRGGVLFRSGVRASSAPSPAISRASSASEMHNTSVSDSNSDEISIPNTN